MNPHDQPHGDQAHGDQPGASKLPLSEASLAPAASTDETQTSVSAPQPVTQTSNTQLGGWTWLIRSSLKTATVVAVVALLLFLVGVAQRTAWILPGGLFSQSSDTADGEIATGDTGRLYICPMMCTPPSSEPGRCPVCGMELVAATGGGGGDGISVNIEPSARRLVGIQTAVSRLEEMTRTIRTIGSIDFDESRLATISAYVDGRLEKMFADYLGVQVAVGEDLALIYSPQLYSAQTEFVTSLDSGSTFGRFQIGDTTLQALASENLSELGMTEEQIAALKQTRQPASRIRIKSPQSGTVIEKSAVEGDYVKTGQQLFRIADLSTVWLMLDLFPDDAAMVRFGQQIEAEIQSVPGEVFTGRVAFIDPTVDKQTRTVQVRVEMLNVDGRLRPGDYATARVSVPAAHMETIYDPALAGKYISPMHPQVIREEPGNCPLCDRELVATSQLGYASQPQPQQRVVTVPRDAVLLTGDNGVLYVETEPGRFEIRRVTVGSMNDQRAVILEGLAAGETVATGGNFLIDSQMQLAGNPSLLDPSQAPGYPPGPINLPNGTPVLLAGKAAEEFDNTYNAYFEIQQALAADTTPSPMALKSLVNSLSQLEMAPGVPEAAQRELARSRSAAGRLDGSLETARQAFRLVSHSLLRAANVARGPSTSQALNHYYCPMVPGGGGDWMQAGGPLANPYWGSEMLRCGELVSRTGAELDSGTAAVGEEKTELQ